MPKLAKTIDVKRRGREVTLTIDGEEFAWYLAREPITTTTDPNEPGTVNLTLIAEHVTIDDDTNTTAQAYAYVETVQLSGATDGRTIDYHVVCNQHPDYHACSIGTWEAAAAERDAHDRAAHPQG